MRPISTTALAVLVTALASTAAAAQTPPASPPRPNRAAAAPRSAPNDSQPGMRRQGPRGPGIGPAQRGPASALLRMRGQLDLTDDQVKKLEALQATPRPERNQSDMLRAQADLMDATRGDVNIEKARAAFDRMARIRTDAQLAQLKTRQDVRSVLTQAQRAKFDAFASSMRQRRGDIGARGRGPQMRGNAVRGNMMRGNAMRGSAMRGRGGPIGAGRRGPAGPGMRGPMMGPGRGPAMGGPGMGGPGMGGAGMGGQRLRTPGMGGPNGNGNAGPGMAPLAPRRQRQGPPQRPPQGPPDEQIPPVLPPA